MNKARIIIASTHKRNFSLANELEDHFNVLFFKTLQELNVEKIEEFNPQYIFFPHWSWLIPDEIYLNYECVIFHMTDLPFGRGGSPLQNLISNGHEETKLSAIRCVKEMDAGPVYLKKALSLFGTAEEIFLRSNNLMKSMVIEIVSKEIKPIQQVGEATVFKRRKPVESNIQGINDIENLFNHIRMLDADSYPLAFLENDEFKFEFSRASLKSDSLNADVKITRKRK